MGSKQVMGDGRRAEAMAAAEACAALLRERFDARRVIPFGSLVGKGPWHESSDLDHHLSRALPRDAPTARAAVQEH